MKKQLVKLKNLDSRLKNVGFSNGEIIEAEVDNNYIFEIIEKNGYRRFLLYENQFDKAITIEFGNNKTFQEKIDLIRDYLKVVKKPYTIKSMDFLTEKGRITFWPGEHIDLDLMKHITIIYDEGQ